METRDARHAEPPSATLNAGENSVPAEREPTTAAGRTKPRFSVVRVLVITVVLVALAGAVVAISAFGLPASIQGWFDPALVPATGRVFHEGKPIPAGTILTAPLDGQPTGAIGLVQEDGRFKFETQVNDRYVDGIYVGRHKVAVNYGQPKMMGVIPLVPEKYFTLSGTVLTINVSQDPAKNDFEFKLEGELTQEALRALGRLPENESEPRATRRGGPRGSPPEGVDADAQGGAQELKVTD
jgi:hypothetical protein